METPEVKVPFLNYPRIMATPEFIEKNQLKFIRTQDEIVKRIEDDNKHLFGHAAESLIHYTEWKHSVYLYNPEYVKKVEESGEYPEPLPFETCVQDFLDYMNFAWTKALDERGLSASRSINKLGHWLWLMGRDDLYSLINEDELYNPYGAPALIAVCKELGIDVPAELVEFAKHPY